jgi:hypothetical protein
VTGHIGDVIDGGCKVTGLLGVGGMDLPDPGTASDYKDRLRRVGDGIFSVTRTATDCAPARRKVTISTYKAFEAARRRLERDPSTAGDFKVRGIAIDPAAGSTRGSVPLGFTRYRTDLIEV